MTAISFDVRGIPVPQGSARAFVAGGKARVVTGATHGPLADWRHAIATEARAAVSGAPLLGPVRVQLVFRFPRPQSHYLPAGARRPKPELRLDAPELMVSRPDADKIARAGLDALTGVLYRDDSQVAELRVTKRYAGSEEGPGVYVSVQSLAVTA